MKRIDIVKLWPLIIFTFALAVRFIFLSGFQNSPFFYPDVKGVDPSLYHEWARDLAEGYWPGNKLLYGHPFYPYLVSFIYRYLGPDIYSVVVIQLLLGSISCVLIYFIARYVFCAEAGVISSFIAAVYGPFLFYEAFLMPNTLAIFLNLSAIIMLFNIIDFPRLQRTILAGLLLGCSVATNSGIAPFIFFSVFWIIWALRKQKAMLFAHLVCLIISIILPVTFLLLKHFTTEGRFDSFAAHGGINFYVGNNPESSGGFKAPFGFTPGAEGLSEDSSAYAERALGRQLSAAEVSKFWYKQAFKWISGHPVLWARLLFKKFILFWNSMELGDVGDYYFSKRYSSLLKFNPVTFVIIAPMGLSGMVLASRNIKKPFLLYGCTASFMVSCVLFFVNSRYRLSGLPFLIIFAGFAAHRLYQKISARDFRAVKIYASAFTVFFVFSNAKLMSMDTTTPLYNLSVIYAQKSRYDDAIEISKDLLKTNRNLPAVHFNLGVCFYGKKMADAAVYEFQQALRFNPNDYDSHFNLGFIFYEKKDYKKSLEEFKASLRGNDKDGSARFGLGNTYSELGDFQKALEEYKMALKICPQSKEVKMAIEETAKKIKSSHKI